MEKFQLYHDMQVRTNGEIYLGVVGPVRTGKSTFIKRFMDLLVLPHMGMKIRGQGRWMNFRSLLRGRPL